MSNPLLDQIFRDAQAGTLEPQQVDEFAIYLNPHDSTELVIHEITTMFRLTRALTRIESASHLAAILNGLRK